MSDASEIENVLFVPGSPMFATEVAPDTQAAASPVVVPIRQSWVVVSQMPAPPATGLALGFAPFQKKLSWPNAEPLDCQSNRPQAVARRNVRGGMRGEAVVMQASPSCRS